MDHVINIPYNYNQIIDSENYRAYRQLLPSRILNIIITTGLVIYSIYAINRDNYCKYYSELVTLVILINLAKILLMSYSLKLSITTINENNHSQYTSFRLIINAINFIIFVFSQVIYYKYNAINYNYLGCALMIYIIYTYILLFLRFIIIMTLFLMFRLCRTCRPQLYNIIMYLLNYAPEARNGIAESDLNKLKSVTFCQHLNIDSEHQSCIICSEDYIDGEILTELLCKHYFHKNCSDKWLVINKSCPICRAQVVV